MRTPQVGDIYCDKRDRYEYVITEVRFDGYEISDGIKSKFVKTNVFKKNYALTRVIQHQGFPEWKKGAKMVYTKLLEVMNSEIDASPVADEVRSAIWTRHGFGYLDIKVEKKYLSGKTRLEADDVIDNVYYFRLTREEDQYLVKQIINEVSYILATKRAFLEDVMEEIING